MYFFNSDINLRDKGRLFYNFELTIEKARTSLDLSLDLETVSNLCWDALKQSYLNSKDQTDI